MAHVGREAAERFAAYYTEVRNDGNFYAVENDMIRIKTHNGIFTVIDRTDSTDSKDNSGRTTIIQVSKGQAFGIEPGETFSLGKDASVRRPTTRLQK